MDLRDTIMKQDEPLSPSKGKDGTSASNMGFCVNERKTIMKKKLGKTSEITNAEEVQILYIFRIFKLFFEIVKNSFLLEGL
jgi:hypothetical protein